MVNPKIYFIKSSDGEAPPMEEAFLACKSQQTETLLCDMAEFRDVYKKQLNPILRNIVVTNTFSGDDFNELNELKNIRLVGPLCVLACLNDGISIPNSMGPLLNIAMKDAVVCCSCIPKIIKARITKHVKLMYGTVTDDFLVNTTHLVTDSVITVKYARAGENGKHIMTPAWIEAIWKESQDRVVRYDNEEFNKYKCPVFHNLRICATGFEKSLIDTTSKLIREHGGTFSNEMSLSRTDVLICHGENIHNSSKYRAIISRRGLAANIRCLSSQWIHASIISGYALSEENYAIHNRSTPNAKVGNESGMDSQMFLISRIKDADLSTASCTTIDETMTRLDKTKRDISKTIDLSVLKQAGTFLDGCNIYLICIIGDDLAFTQRALKYTGAIRLDSYSDRVTHVVVGDEKNDVNRQELRTLIERLRNQQAVHIVSTRWLVDSIKRQSLLAEDKYSVSMETSPQASQDMDGSPLSKKGLKLLRTNTSIRTEASELTVKNDTPTNTTLKAPDELQQYMQPAVEIDTLAGYWNDANTEDLTGVNILKNATLAVPANPDEMKINADESNFLKIRKRGQLIDKRISSVKSVIANNLGETSKVITTPSKLDDSTITESNDEKTLSESSFQKKTFLLLQFDTNDMDELTNLINALDGCVVSRASGSRSYRGVTDYAIVPLFSDREATRTVTAEHVLTDLWVRECTDKRRPVVPEYYHRCITEEANNALEGCVVTPSAFNQWEQTYLSTVIGHMGGCAQGQLCKTTYEERGLLPSTHLLTNSTEQTKKYTAAQRWGLVIICSRWAEECLRAGKRLPEVNYPVVPEGCVDTSSFVTPKSVTSRDNSSKKLTKTFTDTHQDGASVSNPGTPQSYVVKRRMAFAPETPLCQSPAFSQSSPSQVSPVTLQFNEIMSRIKSNVERGVLYDSDCDTPTKRRLNEQWALLKTPETPATPYSTKLLGPDATRAERRELRAFLKQIPNNTPPPASRTRRLSTPMSELKRRFIAKCDENYENECQKLRKEAQDKRQALEQEPQEETSESEDDDVMHYANDATDNEIEKADKAADTSNVNVPAHVIEEKLRNLSDMLGTPIPNSKPPKPISVTPVAGFSELPDSQTYSVGWDYDVETFTAAKPDTKERLFLITGCLQSEKDELQNKIERLGAKVVLEHTKFDKITHLLCSTVTRNEKTLSSVASGKWVLHVDFIEESLKAGKFLDEELFEFCNPKSKITIENRASEVAGGALYWRQTIEKTGKGAFHGMRAIIVSKLKDNCASIGNLIEAGGGSVVQSRPPYENNDYATHCLIEGKVTNDLSDFVPLAKCGIYCVRHVYIFDYLIKRKLNIAAYVIPQLAHYYPK